MSDLDLFLKHANLPAKGLFTPSDLATAFGVSTRTVRSWIAAGRLAAARCGRRPYITQSELARFVAAPTHEQI